MMPDSRDDIDLIRKQLAATKIQSLGSRQLFSPLTSPVKGEVDVIKEGYRAIHERIKERSRDGVISLDDLDEPIPITTLEIKSAHLLRLASSKNQEDDFIDLLGFSEQTLLCFYCIAKQFYDEKLLDEALAAFILLTHIAPQVSPFWLGLGLVYESQQEWQKANSTLQKAIQTNPVDFTPFQVLIRVAAEMHDFNEVLLALENHKDTPEIQNEVETALQLLPQIMKGGL